MIYTDMKFNLLPPEWLLILSNSLLSGPLSFWLGPADQEVPVYRCNPLTLAWIFQALMVLRKRTLAGEISRESYRRTVQKWKLLATGALFGFTEAELTKYESLCAESDAGMRLPAPLKPARITGCPF